MANDQKPRPPQGGSGTAGQDRAKAVEALAATIYAPLAATAGQRGKTYDAVAADAIAAARAFFRAVDDQPQQG